MVLHCMLFSFHHDHHNSFGVVFATVVQFFCDIPSSHSLILLGVPISGKIFAYSLALQVSINIDKS